MKQRLAFSTVEWIKTILIFVLIVLMLVLTVLLMIGQNGTNEEVLPQADRMVIYASGVQPMYASGVDTARVSPYLVAWRRDGQQPQILHAAEAARKPYEVLYPLLRELLGSDAVGYTVEPELGARLWSACIDMTDFVFIRYLGALPASVICAYTYSEEDGGSVTVSDEHMTGASAYIREMFLIPVKVLAAHGTYGNIFPITVDENTDAVCALACDERGDITLFCLADPVSGEDSVSAAAEIDEDPEVSAEVSAVSAMEDIGDLALYINSIAALSTERKPGVLQTASDGFSVEIFLDGLYHMPQLTVSGFTPKEELYTKPQSVSAILGILGMRERDGDNYYTDSDGNRVYLNALGRLTVSKVGSYVHYDALQDGGLALSDYLGYTSFGGDYLLSEYLRASDRLLSLLETQESVFGGDALVCSLFDVRLVSEDEGDTLVLTYGYTYRGIPLLDDGGQIRRAMVLHARSGVISHLELYPCHAEISAEEQYLLPQSVVLEAMALEYQAQETSDQTASLPRGLSMAYLGGTEDGYGTYTADWIGLLPH